MLNYKVKIGLAPIRRDVTPRPGIFNWEKAEERGEKLVKYITEHFASDDVSFVTSDGVNERNIIYTEKDAEVIADRFIAEKVDAVFIINCNFGNEEAAAELAKRVGKPVLLWAPLDDVFEEDGTRYTDSQCGIFGMSRQMMRRKIPFSYIPNCRVEEKAFAEAFDRFVSVTCMVNNFKGMRVGQIGLRPKPFCSVIYNESQLMEEFDIRIIPINMAVIADKYNRILAERFDECRKGAEILKANYDIDDLSADKLEKIYAFVLLYIDLFKEYDLDAMASECWTSMQLAFGAMPCAAFSILADMGYVVGCETDVHATISLALLKCATRGKNVPFLGEFTVRHPEDINTELLWHCGPFAYSLKKPTSHNKLVNMRPWFNVKDGEFTVARIDQECGKYSIIVGTCKSGEGPYTFGTYLWAKFNNLPLWEKRMIEGPYIHHVSEIEGDYVGAFEDFCKYVNVTAEVIK